MTILKHFRKKMRCKRGFIGTAIAIGGALGVAGGGLAAGLAGGALLGAGALGIGSLLTGGFGGGSGLELPAAPATPSFEEAQGTSLEEQRQNLRRKSRTTLTSPNLLETQGDVAQKTLLGG